MKIKKIKIGNKEVMPFTIPSGIIMTNPKCAERILNMNPYIGIWTTKSIGVKERIVPEGDEVKNPDPNKEYGFREPIFAQIDEETFVNAVRLVNPGKDKMREYLLKADIPKDKIINASVFGGTIKEIVSVINTLDDVVDMFEINGSCPHSEKGGMIIGLDPKSVYEFTEAAVGATKKPVLFKLTPNTDKIGLLAKAVKAGGGYGIVAINTIGPYVHYVDGYPVLTSKIGGGKSGKGILERGLECIRESKQAVGKDFLIVGMCGIGIAEDVIRCRNSGADVVGIGTRLIGMTENELIEYFPVLVSDIENKTNNAESLLKKVNMDYQKIKITEKINNSCDFKLFKTNTSIKSEPGQFVFAWIPEIGEKPFSIMDNDPLTLGILERGEFTKKFNSLEKGDSFYVRGPYGNGIDIPHGSNVVLVGGGCGIAGINLIAKKTSKRNLTILLGAKDKEHIPYLDEFKKYGNTYIATEDGSSGIKGIISDLFSIADLKPDSRFYNCGSRAMVNAVIPFESKISKLENIYSSVDYMTRCGVGICGSCADEKGRRTCIEGPFMRL